MKKICIILCALMSLFGTMSAQTINDYKFEIGEFTHLKVLDNANVEYRCVPDSAGLAVYRGVEDFADSFIIKNTNGTVRIQVTTEDVDKPDLPTLTLYSSFLESASNEGVGKLHIASLSAIPEIKLTVMGNGSLVADGINATKAVLFLNTGNGTLVANGRAQNVLFKMVGTGVIQADELQAEDVRIKLMGGGSIGCWATRQLKSSGIGSTKIYYKGSPKISKSGGGKLLHLESGITEALEKNIGN